MLVERIFQYNKKKDALLREARNISFAQIIFEIEAGNVLDVIRHHNKAKYPSQFLYIVHIDGYAWVVPCEIRGEVVMLKTAFPDRKMTKLYLRH